MISSYFTNFSDLDPVEAVLILSLTVWTYLKRFWKTIGFVHRLVKEASSCFQFKLLCSFLNSKKLLSALASERSISATILLVSFLNRQIASKK